MSRRRVPPTPARPMPRTGSIFPPGAGGRTSLPFPRIRTSSASTSPLAPPGPPAGREGQFRLHDRAAPLGDRLELHPTGHAARPQGPRHRHRHGGGTQSPHRPAAAKGGDPAGRPDRHARDPGTRHASGPAGPGTLAGGLRRKEITGLDLGRDQTEDGCGWIEILVADVALQDRLTRGRDRPRFRRHPLSARRRRDLDQVRQARQRPPLPPRHRTRQRRWAGPSQ
ncbi:hypothetical protein EV291_111134 [Rhizobium sp. BK068]|nr:hypothetical protein EV291_111134 [Rhizobium sp. BK068]